MGAFDRAYAIGEALADATVALLPTLAPCDDTTILSRQAVLPCPYEGTMLVQILDLFAMPFRALHRVGAGDDATWLLDEVPFSWHKLGPIELVAVPGEATPELSLRLRQRVTSPLAFLVAQGNDAVGYLVDPESVAADPTGRLATYELGLGPGPKGGPLVWDTHAALGWFDGAWRDKPPAP